MIDLALFPETPATGPAWVCAELRLLRPYRHPSLRGRLRHTIHRGCAFDLPHRTDAVVIQRGGPTEMSFGDLVALVDEVAKRGLPLIYDLDDDLLSEHPVAEVEIRLRAIRPKVRYLLRAASVVIVSTEKLGERIAHLARKWIQWPNSLDESLFDSLAEMRQANRRAADIGYMGTPTHLWDLMSVVPAIGEAIGAMSRKVRVEFLGVSDDERIRQLWQRRAGVSLGSADGDYEAFMRKLASRSWKIGLAPLANLSFNACKSDIKFLDYSAAGIPGVYADSGIYRVVAENDAGLVASPAEFGSKVLALLSDHATRERLTRNAAHYVRDQRCLAQSVPRLWAVIEECLDTVRQSPVGADALSSAELMTPRKQD